MTAPEMMLTDTTLGDTSAGGMAAGDRPAAPGSRRKLRNYLVDSALQLRFAGYVGAVAAALSGALGWRIWQAYVEASKLVALGDSRTDEVVAAALRAEDEGRILVLAGALGAVVLALLALAIVLTHRVAGPAVALSQVCRQVVAGALPAPRPLRRGDLLVGLAGEVSAVVEALRAREDAERQKLAEALDATPERAREIVASLAAEKARRLDR